MQVRLILETSEAELEALAQFVKRIGWTDIRQNAANDEEAQLMRAGLDRIRSALADLGYEPR